MAKFTFEDLSGATAAMMWPSEFSKFETILKEDFIGFARGTLNRSREPAEFVISKVIPLERGAAELSKGLIVRLHKGSTQPTDVERLLRTVRAYPGNLDLYLEILGLAKVRRAIYKAGASLKIRHDERLLADLESGFGIDNVRLLGHRGTTGRDEHRPRPVPQTQVYGTDAGLRDEEE